MAGTMGFGPAALLAVVLRVFADELGGAMLEECILRP